VATENPIQFVLPQRGGAAYGYPATMLADICEALLAAHKAEALQKQQLHLADQAEIWVRGFARVGIIALVDEATGYQKNVRAMHWQRSLKPLWPKNYSRGSKPFRRIIMNIYSVFAGSFIHPNRRIIGRAILEKKPMILFTND